MKTLASIAAITWMGLWLTPDQQATRLMKQGEHAEAAKLFENSAWKGIAHYRAGNFEEALAIFGAYDSAESYYNRGNCCVMLGKYQDAIALYDSALKLRPDWQDAAANRELAAARAEMLEAKGGDMGDQRIGADDVVFDKNKKDGQDTKLDGSKAADDASVQALWLRRVQTKPADFLRKKFAFQAKEGEKP